MEEVNLSPDPKNLEVWSLYQVAIFFRSFFTRIRRVEMWFPVFETET